MDSLHNTLWRSWLNANPFHYSGALTMSAYAKPQRSTEHWGECLVWMAPALQEISVIAMVCQYSRVSGLFAWRLPLALMSSASKVPIG